MTAKKQMTISAFCGTKDTLFVLRAGARLVYAADNTWLAWQRVRDDDRRTFRINRKRMKSYVAARLLFGEHARELANRKGEWRLESGTHQYECLNGVRFKSLRIYALARCGARFTIPFVFPGFGPCIGFELPGGIQGILMACLSPRIQGESGA